MPKPAPNPRSDLPLHVVMCQAFVDEFDQSEVGAILR